MGFYSDANPDDRGRSGGFPHLSDPTGAHDAFAIGYDGTSSGLAATDVQAAIDELATEDAAAHIADTTAAHAASALANTPAGNIAATDVQAAINELDDEKAGLALANVFTEDQRVATGKRLIVGASDADNGLKRIITSNTILKSHQTETTGKNPAPEVTYWQLLNTSWTPPSQSWISPGAGSPGNFLALPSAFAHGHHQHQNELLSAGDGRYASYPADYGGPTEDLGVVTTDGGPILWSSMQVPAYDAAGVLNRITDVVFYSGATAMSGCTHLFAAVYGYGDGTGVGFPLIGQSTDAPGATWAANSAKTFSINGDPSLPNLGSSNPEANGILFVGLFISATQHPSLLGFRVHPTINDVAYAIHGTTSGVTTTAPNPEIEEWPTTASARLYCRVGLV